MCVLGQVILCLWTTISSFTSVDNNGAAPRIVAVTLDELTHVRVYHLENLKGFERIFLMEIFISAVFSVLELLTEGQPLPAKADWAAPCHGACVFKCD